MNAGEIQSSQAQGLWKAGPPFQQIGPFFVLFATPDARLQLVNAQPATDPHGQLPQNPIQYLYLDTQLERTLSEASDRAFEMPLTVNRVSGPNIYLHVGEVEDVGEPVVTNAAYREAIWNLPQLQNEGDGVRSYVGILLAITAATLPGGLDR